MAVPAIFPPDCDSCPRRTTLFNSLCSICPGPSVRPSFSLIDRTFQSMESVHEVRRVPSLCGFWDGCFSLKVLPALSHTFPPTFLSLAVRVGDTSDEKTEGLLHWPCCPGWTADRPASRGRMNAEGREQGRGSSREGGRQEGQHRVNQRAAGRRKGAWGPRGCGVR